MVRHQRKFWLALFPLVFSCITVSFFLAQRMHWCHVLPPSFSVLLQCSSNNYRIIFFLSVLQWWRGSNDFPVKRKVNFQKCETMICLQQISLICSLLGIFFLFGALDQEHMEGALLHRAVDRNRENPVHGATNEQGKHELSAAYRFHISIVLI